MSTRITKAIAEAVAKQLVQSKQAEIKQIQDNEADFISGFYEASLSQLVKDGFKKHKGFFHTSSSIRLSGSGLTQGYRYYALNKNYPVCNSCPVFPVSDEQANTIIEFETQIEEKTKSMRELFNNIEAALINLRTYNNIEKEFPEAFALLPKQAVNTALAINIKDIRCKLDKANC